MSEKIKIHWSEFISKNTNVRERHSDNKDVQTYIVGLCASGFFFDDNDELISFEEAINRFKTLAEHSNDNGLNFLLGAHYFASILPIIESGNHLKALAVDACLTGKTFCNAISEDSSGSDAFDMATTANRKENKFIINGHKSFISNAPHASYCLMYAKTNNDKGAIGGLSAFVLEKGEFDILKEYDKMGLKSCIMGKIGFENVEIPEQRMVGDEGTGFQLFNQAMVYERIGLSAIHVGSMKRLLDSAVKFANTRESGGRLIGKYQSVSNKIADLYLYLSSSEGMLNHTMSKLNSRVDAMKNAAACKLFVSEQYNKFCSDLMDIYAGRGYISDYGIEEELRDARASLYYSGTNEIQRSIISKCLGL